MRIVCRVLLIVHAWYSFIYVAGIVMSAFRMVGELVDPIGTIVFSVIFPFSLLCSICCFNVLRESRHARIYGKIVAIIQLPLFPLGTLLGALLLICLVKLAGFPAEAYSEQHADSSRTPDHHVGM